MQKYLIILFFSTLLSVDYNSQIQSYFNTACTQCHGSSGGLNLTSYSNLISGGNHGPVIISGNSAESILIQKLLGTTNFGSQMPNNNPPSSEETITLISTWIDEGANEFESYDFTSDNINDTGSSGLVTFDTVNPTIELTYPLGVVVGVIWGMSWKCTAKIA